MTIELDKKVYEAQAFIEEGGSLDQIIDHYLTEEEIRVVICNYSNICRVLNDGYKHD